YKIQISKASNFLTKLVGNNDNFVGQKELIDDFFANEFQGKIRSKITRHLNETQSELLGIEDRIEEIAESITPSIAESFEEYGVRIVKFSIASMEIIDDEIRRKYDEIGMANIEKLRRAQADKGVMEILGDDWARQQSTEILHTMAGNTGAGGVAAAGAGLGMGVAAGGAFSGISQQIFAPPQQQPASTPQAAPTASAEDPMETLKKLKAMLDAGLIPQESYDAKMAEVLSRM
ncbi:MAG: SPFH domain-containing protein, partial [Akkermansia sp.]|nr:SPFH domain-containing protein [Akkermansia sp.]